MLNLVPAAANNDFGVVASPNFRLRHGATFLYFLLPLLGNEICRSCSSPAWNDDVDVPVAVDEAMTLGRMLSTDDSPRFLNGLLGRIGDLADTLR